MHIQRESTHEKAKPIRQVMWPKMRRNSDRKVKNQDRWDRVLDRVMDMEEGDNCVSDRD